MKKPFPKMVLRILLVCVLLLGFLYMDDDIGTSAANLESDIRNLQKIPENLQEFEILAAKGRKPEHICALFLCALALFDRDKDAGTAAMNLLRGPRLMTPYDAQFLRDRLRGKPYLPFAYFEGAAPENGYQPRAPYRLNVLADPRPQDMEPGYLRVFLKTAGADSPRPMKLRQKASTGQNGSCMHSCFLPGLRVIFW